ncbi:MAG: serine/threonine-protein kinase, partial [Thermoanaerobaculia bacterium]
MIGKTLVHYKILEKLGSGGMGDVYRAQDAKLERDVALKILPLEMADDPERRKRFEREAKAIAALKHPHIVTIHSIEESEGSHFITMELVKGRTLSDIISTGNLSLAQFFELTIPLADAVASAHASGIIHRDLKPDNIMLDADGTLKVLDFGLAKMSVRDSELTSGGDMPTEILTQPGMIMGTLPYMSPEQVQGLPVNAPSDVFSLGVIFYELATGRRPFGGTSTAELASSILRDEPTPLNDVRSDYPAALHAAVSRCLEKNAHARYATAGEVLAALETVERSPATPTPASADPSGGTIAVFDFENITRDSAADWL